MCRINKGRNDRTSNSDTMMTIKARPIATRRLMTRCRATPTRVSFTASASAPAEAAALAAVEAAFARGVIGAEYSEVLVVRTENGVGEDSGVVRAVVGGLVDPSLDDPGLVDLESRSLAAGKRSSFFVRKQKQQLNKPARSLAGVQESSQAAIKWRTALSMRIGRSNGSIRVIRAPILAVRPARTIVVMPLTNSALLALGKFGEFCTDE
jgi:hypothetical protein